MTNAQRDTINWRGGIEKNRTALLRIVEMLFALIGLDGNAAIATLPRCTRNYVLRILRPAEAAARRLIIIAGREVVVSTRPCASAGSRARRKPSATTIVYPPGYRPVGETRRAETDRAAPELPLLDPLKRFSFHPPIRGAKSFPRISIIGITEPRPIPAIRPPSPDDPQDARRLCIRLQALKRALDDLPGQARRLARWKARRDLGVLRARRLCPMRPGWPPGHRKRPAHDIDDILRECHALARSAWQDSS